MINLKVFFVIILFFINGVVASELLDRAEALTLQSKYDEALDALSEFEEYSPRYYYNRMICEYALIQRDAALKSAEKLLRFAYIPRRYEAMGHLLKADLEKFRPETLDHVARLMKSSERRLDIGQAGPKVQKDQEEIIAILEQLIEKAEGSEDSEEQDEGSGEAEGQNPANESKVKGKKGSGKVDKKNIKQTGGWGDLPPKEAAAAKQYMDKHFPPHYRKAVEEYFKRLAERKRKR